MSFTTISDNDYIIDYNKWHFNRFLNPYLFDCNKWPLRVQVLVMMGDLWSAWSGSFWPELRPLRMKNLFVLPDTSTVSDCSTRISKSFSDTSSSSSTSLSLSVVSLQLFLQEPVPVEGTFEWSQRLPDSVGTTGKYITFQWSQLYINPHSRVDA
jgi:hypothetical protein